MDRLSAIFGATLAVLLAGCADSISVVENEHSSTFGSEEYAHDASRGDIPVVVAGSAFGLGQRLLADIVVRNMQGADWSPHAHFTAQPGAETARMYSYAMLFNGPQDITASALCAEPRTASSVPPSGAGAAAVNMTLVAALCRYNVATMGVTARVANVSGPDDPKFRSLVRTAVFQLTRPNQRRIGRDHDSGSSNSNDSHP